MSTKQDRTVARTPTELERSYQFGKTFAKMFGMIEDSRDHVDKVESSLRSEITEQVTTLSRDTERIIMSALETYVQTGELEEYQKTVETELQILADKILMNFTTTTEQISEVDGDLQTKYAEIKKYISFEGGNITLGSNESAITLVIANERISFRKNGAEFGSWDGNNFYTGNIVVKVNERAQYGGFAFVPRSDRSLMFVKVGE